ncbi:Small Integral Membrane Protein 14 [Manis pentadactyla]|nr:Small Integral Membrane Protein 14 [Manis pentadactyla]
MLCSPTSLDHFALLESHLSCFYVQQFMSTTRIKLALKLNLQEAVMSPSSLTDAAILRPLAVKKTVALIELLYRIHKFRNSSLEGNETALRRAQRQRAAAPRAKPKPDLRQPNSENDETCFSCRAAGAAARAGFLRPDSRFLL